MALTLALSALERNDSKILTLTDTTTNWGSGGNIDYTSIKGISNQTYSLTATITVETPNSVQQFDAIDLHELHGSDFVTQSDLVFPIGATNLKISEVPYGDSNTLLPDGIYTVVYTVNYYNVSAWETYATLTVQILVYGQVKTDVYNKLRVVPNLYDSSVCRSKEVQDALLYYTYLESIEKSAFIARKDELLQMLETLQRLILNGSNYPW